MKKYFHTFINKRICSTLIMTIACMPYLAKAADEETMNPAITYMLKPIYPVSLSMLGISEGSATILISLDSEGRLMDWIPLSATRPEYVKAIGYVIDKWEFRPAAKNGSAIPYAICISIKFRSDGIQMCLNNFQMLQHYLTDGKGGESEVPMVAKYSELDRLPEPATIVQPVLGSDVPAGSREGDVTIRFIIDSEGKVRMPVMMECNGDVRLAYAAYDAVVKWKFSAPMEHGKPTMVKASQKFIFKNASSTGK